MRCFDAELIGMSYVSSCLCVFEEPGKGRVKTGRLKLGLSSSFSLEVKGRRVPQRMQGNFSRVGGVGWYRENYLPRRKYEGSRCGLLL